MSFHGTRIRLSLLHLLDEPLDQPARPAHGTATHLENSCVYSGFGLDLGLRRGDEGHGRGCSR